LTTRKKKEKGGPICKRKGMGRGEGIGTGCWNAEEKKRSPHEFRGGEENNLKKKKKSGLLGRKKKKDFGFCSSSATEEVCQKGGVKCRRAP